MDQAVTVNVEPAKICGDLTRYSLQSPQGCVAELDGLRHRL
ncbi:MAG: hypothetical protein AAFW95_08790 [Cyanobacteria bacterium J06638_6]